MNDCDHLYHRTQEHDDRLPTVGIQEDTAERESPNPKLEVEVASAYVLIERTGVVQERRSCGQDSHCPEGPLSRTDLVVFDNIF